MQQDLNKIIKSVLLSESHYDDAEVAEDPLYDNLMLKGYNWHNDRLAQFARPDLVSDKDIEASEKEMDDAHGAFAAAYPKHEYADKAKFHKALNEIQHQTVNDYAHFELGQRHITV